MAIPRGTIHPAPKGRGFSLPLDPTVYKCYECGKGELADEIVELIKKFTKIDVAAGTCGTPLEKPLFFICDKCIST